MSAIAAIAVKDLRLLLRDRGDVFFTFVFPVLIAVLFGFVFGGSGGGSRIELGIVREGSSRFATGLAEDLAADGAFEARAFATREDAAAAVRAGKVSAAAILPKSLDAGPVGIFSGDGLEIDVIVDPARRAEAGLIQGKLNELAFRQFPRLLADDAEMERLFGAARASVAGASGLTAAQKLLGTAMLSAAENFRKSVDVAPTADRPARDAGSGGPEERMESEQEAGGAGDQPRRSSPDFSLVSVRLAELAPHSGRPRSPFDVTFPQGIVWGLAGCFGAFAASLVAERARGTLARLRLAPITIFHLVSGKAIACLVAGLLVETLVLGVAVTFFGAAIAQPAMLAVACFAAAFAFAGLATALAGFCRTEAEANGAGRGAILILALVGGGTIPLFFMPPFLRTLSYGSPFRWAVTAIEGPFWRDVPVSEQFAPIAVLLAIGAGGWIVGARALGWRLRRT